MIPFITASSSSCLREFSTPIGRFVEYGDLTAPFDGLLVAGSVGFDSTLATVGFLTAFIPLGDVPFTGFEVEGLGNKVAVDLVNGLVVAVGRIGATLG